MSLDYSVLRPNDGGDPLGRMGSIWILWIMGIQGTHPPNATIPPQEIAGLIKALLRSYPRKIMVDNTPLIRPDFFLRGKRGIRGVNHKIGNNKGELTKNPPFVAIVFVGRFLFFGGE